MNLTNPQRQLGKWPLSVQMEQPWRCLEYARMEDCLQQRTRRVFHDNCSGKTRRVSPQGLLGNWSFNVQVDHPWRLEVMLERRDILLLGIPLPLQRSALFVTCTSSFLWENSQQCFLETDMFQTLGFLWMSLFLPLEMRHKEKCQE